MRQVACLGEVMMELRPGEVQSGFSLGFAGDSFNTAVMLARQGIDTAYLTRLGSDPFSRQIVQAAKNEGLNTQGMATSGESLPGLYLIQNDDAGERQFFYWRDSSPARQMFVSLESSAVAIALACEAQWLYLSGITAAVMGQYAEASFLKAIQAVKAAGVKIAFDPNYRPQLWASTHEAQRWHAMMLALSDMVLPTLVDEQLLWGASNPQDVIERCIQSGATHVVVKCPDALAVAWYEGNSAELRSHYVGPVLDTTGAGDAFNAGYLAAYMANKTLPESLENAHTVASSVLAVRGALP
ncbi:MAG: 2-dehydro-3-deoxygluconokinase [Litorivivens sp.]|jgi:2-dehydro-3-deoxygluconokinase